MYSVSSNISGSGLKVTVVPVWSVSAHNGHGLGHIAPGELHLIDMSVPVDLDRQPLGKGVHHAGAHAVEAAGDLVAPAAELAAGVEDGVHHLQGGLAGLGLDVHGDAAAVVHHGDGVPLVDSAPGCPCSSRPGPRRWRCPRSHRPDGAGRRWTWSRYTCRAASGRLPGLPAPEFPMRRTRWPCPPQWSSTVHFLPCRFSFQDIHIRSKARRAGPEPPPARFSLP